MDKALDVTALAAQLAKTDSAAAAMAVIEPLSFGDLKRVSRRLGIRVSGFTRQNDLRHHLICHLFGQQ